MSDIIYFLLSVLHFRAIIENKPKNITTFINTISIKSKLKGST